MRALLTLCTIIVAATLAPVADAARDPATSAKDLIVFGKVKTVSYDSLDDLGTNGRFTARLTITRIVRGHPPSHALTIRYIAHSGLVEDRALRFRLRGAGDGLWLVCRDGTGRGYTC